MVRQKVVLHTRTAAALWSYHEECCETRKAQDPFDKNEYDKERIAGFSF
jgi:hypothetical protein